MSQAIIISGMPRLLQLAERALIAYEKDVEAKIKSTELAEAAVANLDRGFEGLFGGEPDLDIGIGGTDL